MTLYRCQPLHFFQVYEYIQEKWYKPCKYVRKENKDFLEFDKKYTIYLYAENEAQAKERYLKVFDIDLLNEKCYDYFELKRYYGFNVKEELESEIFIYITEYENDKNFDYLKKHTLSDDYLLYCKNILLDNDIQSMI